MSKASVKDILHEIDTLNQDDRITLERELSRRLEREWTAETAKARKTARRRGITQISIDQTLHRRRYGQ